MRSRRQLAAGVGRKQSKIPSLDVRLHKSSRQMSKLFVPATWHPTTSIMSKPVLYRFGGSVWAAVPELAFEELGYTDQVVQETVSVLEGENLELKYLKISAQGTLPAIVTPSGELYDSSTSSTQYLIKNAPQGAKTGKPADPKLLEILHADNIDPNFFLLAARNQEELDAKNQSVPGYFIRAHHKVLQRVAPTAPPELKDFYDAKVTKISGLNAIYTPGASSDLTAPYFKASQENWDAVANFTLKDLPTYLPEQGFLGGDIPGEADYHVGAWLARIASVLGAKNETGAWKSFEVFGPVPESLQKYWEAWTARKSWNAVYKDGLH